MFSIVKSCSEWHETYLTQVHDDGLVHLLPQVSAEDLDQRDLEGRDLAVHEYACQVQLHLGKVEWS